MVNSGSFDSDGQGDRNAKAGLTQLHKTSDSTQSSSPVTASVATSCNTGFSQTADSGLPSVAHAIEPTPTKTEFNCDMPVENFTNLSSVDGEAEESVKPQFAEEKTSLCCSLPLEKVQGVLTSYHPPRAARPDDDGAKATAAKQPTRKLLCLYCDRSFVSANLRQKHVERIHSVKQNRRVSSRRQNQLTVTPCVYCDKLNGTENTLKDLFQHLINEHSSKYFGCLPCEDRFLTSSLLADHNAIIHQSNPSQSSTNVEASASPEKTTLKPPAVEDDKVESEEDVEEIPVKITRSKMRPKSEEDDKGKKPAIVNKKKSTKFKELRSRKLSVKSSRIALKRRESKRLQAIAKLTDTQKKKRPRTVEKKHSTLGKADQTNSTKSTEKLKTNPTSINPYPEFDHFYRVKKITDHSIDNLKISSLTFDDVFDKAFFNRIRCNIKDNLLHHIDGKLFKNEESESRISNFEKVSNLPQEIQNSNSENYGCELSLNAVTPVASLSLNSQFGEDFESQIEYGSKPSKKRTQPRKDEIHYKYFTRRKYQASILEHKENRDLSKLDMWTQLVIKKRQQKMLDDKKSAKEILEYASCEEYKNKLKREELNRILDRRGPFEDLKEEASKKAALDKLNSASEENISEETFTEVREVLNEILNRVFATTEEASVQVKAEMEKGSVSNSRKEDVREIPGYLNLRRSSSLPSDGEIDRSDKIALICSSQETENFELPTNQVRGKNELIELTGEWARCRMYICAACGAKLPNMKYLLDHKSLYHQNVWVQHYEFVGNQSELYRHLSIPALGKVGAVEESVQCKLWRRSDARVCTKCGKQCNALGELHRHILECGGDWTWMLARKKCKYRPFGAKSRRKRRGLIHRIHHKQKTEPTEKKKYKKTFEGPRQRPSDADTIQRMLANLPAKRSTRKLISLQDGIYRSRKTTQNLKQNKVKCGKMIYKSSSRKETTEKTVNTAPSVSKSQISSSSGRRSLRNLNKVLASRILDTNTNLNVKRKIKALNERRRTRQSLLEQEKAKEIVNDENIEQTLPIDSISSKLKSKVSKKEDVEIEDTEPLKRSSPRSSPKNLKKKMSVKKLLSGKINIKSFFPVKKNKNRKILTESQNPQDSVNMEANTEVESTDIKTRSKRKSKESCDTEEEKKKEVPDIKIIQKKSKSETFSSLVRSLSMRKNKLSKKAIKDKVTNISVNNINMKKQDPVTEKLEENKQEETRRSQEADKIGSKRKLKSSFRNIINKVKKLKIDNSPENTVKVEEVKPNSKNLREGAFLEETNPEGRSAPVRVEKAVVLSISEAKEVTADISTTVPIAMNFNDTNENPPIPETIFKLELNNEKSLQAKGELDFDTQPINTNLNKSSDNSTEINTNIIPDIESNTIIEKNDKTQPISIETSEKPKIVPLISPNMKGKIRKPTRGLNDCIAMLTSKLQQKTVEESSVKVDSIFSTLLSPNKAPDPFRESYAPKTECILRIPTYKSQMIHSEVEETALDLSTKSLRNKEQIPTEEPLTHPLDSYNTILKLKDTQIDNKNFVVPIFDTKLNKVFNSVDRIIEEVVENRFETVPEIRQRKWNSVDDIIQKVIDDQSVISQFKLPCIPTRNSIDAIIDFVVVNGGNADVHYKVNEITPDIHQSLIPNKEVSVRKIGSIRKSKIRKSSVEIVKPGTKDEAEPKIVATVLKESPENICPVITVDINSSVDYSSSPSITKNGSLKKKNDSKNIINNIQKMESKEIVTDTPTISTVPETTDSTPEVVENKNDAEDEINTSTKENSFQNIETTTVCSNSTENNYSHLNDAFIDNSCNVKVEDKRNIVKVKKGTRKVGQVRNRSRPIKVPKDINAEPEKMLIETNVDTLLDIKEIESNPVLECTRNLCVSRESLMTKSDEVKQLSNEDEPHLLENKPMTLQQKPNTLLSDSEDDIPLAALVKSDEKGANVIELKSKDESFDKSLPCVLKTIEENNITLADTKLVGSKSNEIELKDDLLIDKYEDNTTTAKDNSVNELDQVQEAQKDDNLKEDPVVVNRKTKRTIYKRKSRSLKSVAKPDTGSNISNNKSDVDNNAVKMNDNYIVTNKKDGQANDILDSELAAITELLKSEELVKQPIEIIDTNDRQSTVSNGITLDSILHDLIEGDDILTSNIKEVELENSEHKSTQESSNNEEEGKISSDFVPVETKRNAKKSRSAKQKTKGFSHASTDTFQIKDKSGSECADNVLDLPEALVEAEMKTNGNSSITQSVTGKSITESNIIIKKSKSKTKTKSKFDVSDSSLNNVSLDITSSEDNMENMLELKPTVVESNEFSPNTKTKAPKSRSKPRVVKVKLHNSSTFSADVNFDNTKVGNCEKFVVETEESEKKVSNKELKPKKNQNVLKEMEVPSKTSQKYDFIGNTSSDILNESDTDSEIENIFFSAQPEITPKTRARSSKYNGVKNGLDTKITDKKSEIDVSNTSKNIPKEQIEICKEKGSYRKTKGKSSKSKDIEDTSNTFDIVPDVVHQQETDNKEKHSLENTLNCLGEVNDVLSNVTDDVVTSQLEVILEKTPKELKQSLMKNIELTLALTYVPKPDSVHSISDNNVMLRKTEKSDGLIRDFLQPDIKIKKKRPAKTVIKKSVTNDTDCDDNNLPSNSISGDKVPKEREKQSECISNTAKIRTAIQSNRSNRSRSRSLKNKQPEASDSNIPQDDPLKVVDVADCSPSKEVIEDTIENKKGMLRSRSEEIVCAVKKKGNENVANTLNEGLSKSEIVLETIESKIQHDEHTDNTSPPTFVKRKGKHNRRSTRSYRKTKSTGGRTLQINKCRVELKQLEIHKANVEEMPASTTIDPVVQDTNTPLMEKEMNKTDDSSTQAQTKENFNRITSDKTNEEPPIKIVINKQKTRRKSKSFKKIDLKGQNDLFEDFALVIKKPKRVTSIITFMPADTFSKDIYPNYLKKPIEEPLAISKVTPELEEAPEMSVELDSSVEEMDMELDEIPITSNIIERDTKDFLPPVANLFTKTDVDTLVKSLNELENEKPNDKEGIRTVENNTENVPIEELFLPEKELTLPTEAEVEEFLYETDRNINAIDKQEFNPSSENSKMDSRNKNKTLDDSYELVQDLTDLDFVSENINNKTEDVIVENLTITATENTSDKSADKIVEGLLNHCDFENKKDKGESNNIRKIFKKKTKRCKKNKSVKTSSPDNPVSKSKDVNSILTSAFELPTILNSNKVNHNKQKRSKSITLPDISSTEEPQNVDGSLNDTNEKLNKFKDIDSIYAFSESEDLEIEKPIEKPKRSIRKQTKSLSESVDAVKNVTTDVLLSSICDTADVDHSQKDETTDYRGVIKSDATKRRSRSCNLSAKQNVAGEIKENSFVDIQEDRRKSARSAKVKALEHIHDDALVQLTGSEGNGDMENVKTISAEESVTAVVEITNKRVNRRQSRSQNVHRLLDQPKLPDDVELTGEPINDNQVLKKDVLETIPCLNDNIEGSAKKNIDKKPYQSIGKGSLGYLDKELNQNETVLPIENTDNQIKKKNSRKTNKTQKAKKSIDPFLLAIEDPEKSLLLKDIAVDLTGLEELENSIEKELNAEPETTNCSKQLKNKAKQPELSEVKITEPVVEQNEINDLLMDDNNQELRRSRRGSRKIASYNENDLIDPLLDEISGKRKIRKKEKIMFEELENKSQRKVQEEKKLNSDELFDLLKASSNENCNKKPPNECSNNVDGSSTDFNDVAFQNTFENILEQSSALFKKKNSIDNGKDGKTVDSIYEFTDSPENTEPLKDLSLDVTRKKPVESAKSQEEENSISVSVNCPISESRTLIPSTSDILELSRESKTKSLKSDKTDSTQKSNYCEICNKKFIRIDNLTKHKRTLTHIQKLSEIEAKEAAQRSQSDQPSSNSSNKTSNSIIEITSDSSKVTQNLSKSDDINIHDILQESDKANRQETATDHTSFPNNHSLKLADIINDVLNKPVLEGDNDKHNSFSDIIMQNNADVPPEYRRYKSLGERKSFDSEPVEPRPVPISEPYISKTTILEKQISLLENMIENQTGVNYIDDISMSSNNSLENNVIVSPSELSLKQDDSNTYSRINLTKPITNDDSFLKPSQYEEISEDSVNLRSYEDQKLRKTLNRDEELFLECCSLLKSGSEMSSYSNKKSHNKVLNTMGLKQCDEPEWLERKSLVEKPLYDIGNEYSDNSRIPTPLGDSYDDDASNSNTITSNWNINKKVNVFEDISQDKQDDVNRSFSFQEILNEEEEEEPNKKGISKFGGILSKTIGALPKMMKRTPTVPDAEGVSEKKQEEVSDGSIEGKKIITKGARKVFEGLKVSIPTEELNLEEVLNCSPKTKKIGIVNIQNSTENNKLGERPSLSSTKPSRNARKSKPVKNKSQFGSNLLFKMKKKKVTSPTGANKNSDEIKTHDVYDFEETQDNTDVFTKPDFRAFRNMKYSEPVPEPESDTDSRDYVDSFSYEVQSVASSISSSSSKKPKAQENITKKKCMIMGRIFKNAAKSKIEDIDEEIRDIPALENCELLESYVADCKKIIKNEDVVKPKLSEKEINQLFDQLLEDRLGGQDPKTIEPKTCGKSKTEVKKTDSKKKAKPKNKKRTRTNSESTDDEFSLNKNNKKRAYRKNGKAEDNCINLEQELKECIGVASRKSQRKCTSGKQNVLVEYWSSDDSQFEALLETQRIEVKQPNKVVEESKNMVVYEPVSQVSEDPAEAIPVEPVKTTGLDALEKHKPKNTEKKLQQKRKLSSEKKLKSTTPNSEKTTDTTTSNRRKRAAVNPLYHWSSSSEDESQDLIEVKPIRDELEDDEDRPVQHGWIVGDSPKKLVTMLAQAKGKKTDIDCVKEQGKKRTNAVS